MMVENESLLIDRIATLVKSRLQEIDTIEGVVYTFVVPNKQRSNPSFTVDIDSPNFIAKITFWNIGTGQIGVASTLTDEILFDYNCDIRHESEVNTHIDKVFRVMGLK